jgi:hypothetical protein
MRSPGIWDGSGPDAAEEPAGLRSIEPRTLTATRRNLEEIVPSREGVGQETTTARDCLGTDRGRMRTKPSRSTGMDARTITRAHYCILECIHVEVATIARGPQPVER